MDAEQLAKVQRALAEPKRLEILTKVRSMQGEQGTTCSAVIAEFDLAQSTFSHHISELAEAGLVSACRDGKYNRLTVNEDVVEAYLKEIAQRLLTQ